MSALQVNLCKALTHWLDYTKSAIYFFGGLFYVASAKLFCGFLHFQTGN